MPDDAIELLRRGHEARDLDYKGPIAWNEADKASCCALVKDILGMANTGGGYIVIGVSETATGFTLDGLSETQAATFETTRLNRFVQNYADPPINASLTKTVHNGRTFVIIGVPGFGETPHICQKDFPGVLSAATVYVRTANNDTTPLRSSADFRGLGDRAIRNRSDSLLASFRAVLTGSTTTSAPSDAERFESQSWASGRTIGTQRTPIVL